MNHSHVGFKSYFAGFIFFVCLTLLSYFVVVEHLLSGAFAIAVVVLCAIIQSTVQLGIFLDLITEPKPRSNQTVRRTKSTKIISGSFKSQLASYLRSAK